MDKGASKTVADVGAFVLNVFSSVFIIFTNKRLMGKAPNEEFRFGGATALASSWWIA